MKKRIASFFVMICCLAVTGTFCVAEEEKAEQPKPDKDGFVMLFNGKDLSGWEGNPDIWRVENGCIVGETEAEGKKKLTYNTFLILKDKEFSDFVIRFEYRLTKGGNSGVQFRSWVHENDPPFRVSGYQSDFDGDNAHTGIFYGEGFRGILAHRGQEAEMNDNHQSVMVKKFAESNDLKKEIKVEDWNEYEISANDFTFTNKINGHVMSVLTDKDKKERKKTGIIAIQAHVGPPMKVEIRNLRIKPIEK